MLPKPQRSASLAAANAAHIANLAGANSVIVNVNAAPSASAIQLIFEGRVRGDGAWIALACRATNATAAATLLAQPAALSAVPAFGWFVNTAGISEFRVRVVSLTAGSVVVDLGFSDQPTL